MRVPSSPLCFLLLFQVPPASLLRTLLRRPYPFALSKHISDSGQCMMRRLDVGKFWVEVYHSVWFPLIFERFNIFYTDFQSASVFGWDPSVGCTPWIYFTRTLPPMFRLANYLMTGTPVVMRKKDSRTSSFSLALRPDTCKLSLAGPASSPSEARGTSLRFLRGACISEFGLSSFPSHGHHSDVPA